MLSFTWFDVVLVVVLLWSALTGLRAGFARVMVGFVAAIVGLIAGFWCYRMMAEKLMPWVKTATIAQILGFLIIFIGVQIVGALVATLLSRLLRWFGLSWFNHFLGGVAGFVRGAVVIAALAEVFIAFSPSPTPDFLARSRVLPYVTEVTGWLVELAPRQLKDAYNEQMQNLKRLWAHPSDQQSQVA